MNENVDFVLQFLLKKYFIVQFLFFSIKQQKKAAALFREAFGEKLLLEPLEDVNATSYLPSPNQLRRKIILKHKKLATPGAETVNEVKAFSEQSSKVEPKALGQWTPLIFFRKSIHFFRHSISRECAIINEP